MKILSVGKMKTISNTCRFRSIALKKIANQVDEINTEPDKLSFSFRVRNKLFNMWLPIRLPDETRANKQILKKIKEEKYDVIWIDKGITINAKTLADIKRIQPDAILVSYSPDNMALRHNQSQNYLEGFGLYDFHITTKSYILDDLKKMGAKNIIFSNKSYESSFHYPREVTQEDIDRLGADVGFVGFCEEERKNSILYLTRNGIKVRVFGSKKWEECKGDNPNLIIEDHGLFDEDYAKSFKCFKISLCFLRKINYDLQTARTMEIPACGGFMMAERTKEHEALFVDGKEAVFFDNDEDLLVKCKYYLEHDEERKAIALAGRERCIKSGYSNEATLKSILDQIMEVKSKS